MRLPQAFVLTGLTLSACAPQATDKLGIEVPVSVGPGPAAKYETIATADNGVPVLVNTNYESISAIKDEIGPIKGFVYSAPFSTPYMKTTSASLWRDIGRVMEGPEMQAVIRSGKKVNFTVDQGEGAYRSIRPITCMANVGEIRCNF